MACNNCNDQSGQSPPAGFAPSPSNQSGSASSYGGNTTVVSRRYGADCPQPFTTGQTGRTAYAPAWVATLLGGTVGKMLIKVGDAILFLRSRASGWIKYDSVTESVSVDNAPPFVSNVPKGTNFGYVAKTVPTIRQRFDDVTGECVSEGSQEVGSQIMYPRADGRLVLGNVPLAEELTVEQSADAANQTRLDYLEPAIAEAQSDISPDIGFLVDMPSTRIAGGHEVTTKTWMRMRNITLLKSQWGDASKMKNGSLARQVVLVPVPGGGGTNDADTAYQMALFNSPPSEASATFPTGHLQNDTLFWNGAPNETGRYGTLPPIDGDTGAWVAYPRGRGMHLMPLNLIIDSSVAVAENSNSGKIQDAATARFRTATLPTIPAENNGTIGITLRIKTLMTAGAGITVSVADAIDATDYLPIMSVAGVAGCTTSYRDVFVKLTKTIIPSTGATLFFKFLRAGDVTGVANITGVDIYVVAYHL